MKKIEALIRVEKLDPVKDALREIGQEGMTITEAKGKGQSAPRHLQMRAQTYSVDLIRKIKVEVVVPDKEEQKVVDTIMKVAYTGDPGDGVVFVYPIENAYSITTKDTGERAIEAHEYAVEE